MKQFLSIVLRNQFNLFYRFGYTFISQLNLVEFDGNVTNESQKKIVEQFSKTTPFEYDEEYLILHIEKVISSESEPVQLDIQDIVAVYPLSQQAKISIESKIDQRIRLEDPVFEAKLPIIETKIKEKEVEKGISALWKICKIENPSEQYLSDIGIKHIFEGLEYRKNGTKANAIQQGNYWEYLIAYDRSDLFPRSTLGYFYDAGQVFAFKKGLPTFEDCSKIHHFLKKLNAENPTIEFGQIIELLEKEEQLKEYISQTSVDGPKQYIIAPLYLILKDEIRESDDITQTTLFKNLDGLKKFESSFYYSVILLGAFFGFRKFYDIYYEALNLRFHKKYKKPMIKEHIDQEAPVVENKNNAITKKQIAESDKTEVFVKNTDLKEKEVKEEPFSNDGGKTPGQKEEGQQLSSNRPHQGAIDFDGMQQLSGEEAGQKKKWNPDSCSTIVQQGIDYLHNETVYLDSTRWEKGPMTKKIKALLYNLYQNNGHSDLEIGGAVWHISPGEQEDWNVQTKHDVIHFTTQNELILAVAKKVLEKKK